MERLRDRYAAIAQALGDEPAPPAASEAPVQVEPEPAEVAYLETLFFARLTERDIGSLVAGLRRLFAARAPWSSLPGSFSASSTS